MYKRQVQALPEDRNKERLWQKDNSYGLEYFYNSYGNYPYENDPFIFDFYLSYELLEKRVLKRFFSLKNSVILKLMKWDCHSNSFKTSITNTK